MIMVAVGQRDGVNLQVLHRFIQWERGKAFALRVSPGVHQKLVPIDGEHPGTGSDVVVWIEVRYPHRRHG